MPVSYAKWDAIVDSSDDEEAASSSKPSDGNPGRDPAMDEFLNLGREASVEQIQEKIKTALELAVDKAIEAQQAGADPGTDLDSS